MIDREYVSGREFMRYDGTYEPGAFCGLDGRFDWAEVEEYVDRSSQRARDLEAMNEAGAIRDLTWYLEPEGFFVRFRTPAN